MDKGIFYLVCSALIIAVVAASGYTVAKQVKTSCIGMTTVQKVAVVVTPTVSPTATPAAYLRQVLPTVKK